MEDISMQTHQRQHQASPSQQHQQHQQQVPQQPTPATAKQSLHPPCAVFSDSFVPLPAPAPLNIQQSTPPHTPPGPSPSSAAQYDFFHWADHISTPPPDLSSTAPVAALTDDHSGSNPSAATGAWYAFSRGLHTHVGAALFPEHATAPRRATRRPRSSAPPLPSPTSADRPSSSSPTSSSSSPFPSSAVTAAATATASTSEATAGKILNRERTACDSSPPQISPSSPSASLRSGCIVWDREHRPCIVSSLRPTARSSTMQGPASGSGNAHGNPTHRNNTPSPADEITAEQVANGADVQGIPWDSLPFSRTDYRATRMSEQNRQDGQDYTDGLKYLLRKPRRGAQFFDFFKSSRRVKCSIVHFQLRNLAWATSKHDVYVMHDATVVHWDSVAKRKTQVLDLSGTGTLLSSGLGMVQISTMIANDDLVIAGGFYGEMVAKNMRTGTIMHDKRITYDENAITNAIDIFDDTIMTSNNDCHVRCFDMETFARKSSFRFNTPVNHATRQPGGKMVAVAGDDNPIQVLDGDSGEQIAQLHGHGHYSFATGWHPGGRMFATGSQDKTCRVWDVRNMSQSFAVLGAHIGAVRSLRFSSCGKFMVMAEPRDFVHIFDVNGGEFDTCQEIDLFGEIAGIAMTPCAEGLYVAVSDRLYSSLIEYERRDSSLSNLFY